MTATVVAPTDDALPGQKRSPDYRCSATDMEKFAEISGDRNSLHVQSGIVHGAYILAKLSGFVWGLFGDRVMVARSSFRLREAVRVNDAFAFEVTSTTERLGVRLVEIDMLKQANCAGDPIKIGTVSLQVVMFEPAGQ